MELFPSFSIPILIHSVNSLRVYSFWEKLFGIATLHCFTGLHWSNFPKWIIVLSNLLLQNSTKNNNYHGGIMERWKLKKKSHWKWILFSIFSIFPIWFSWDSVFFFTFSQLKKVLSVSQCLLPVPSHCF